MGGAESSSKIEIEFDELEDKYTKLVLRWVNSPSSGEFIKLYIEEVTSRGQTIFQEVRIVTSFIIGLRQNIVDIQSGAKPLDDKRLEVDRIFYEIDNLRVTYMTKSLQIPILPDPHGSLFDVVESIYDVQSILSKVFLEAERVLHSIYLHLGSLLEMIDPKEVVQVVKIKLFEFGTRSRDLVSKRIPVYNL